jgi:hypothetical protein
VTDSAKSQNDVAFTKSVPGDVVPLESILCTEELRQRPWRPPDYATENRALVTLASALAESPRTILQTLAETILEVTRSDSVRMVCAGAGGLLPKRVFRPYAQQWPCR